MKYNNEMFSEFLQRELKKNNLTPYKLAQKIGIPEVTVWRLVTGRVTNPSLEMAEKIFVALGHKKKIFWRSES